MSWLTLHKFDPAPGGIVEPGHAAWHRLSRDWQGLYKDRNDQLGWIEYAAYAIAICIPFTMRYPKDHSPIIYIGEGMAHARFREHLAEKLLPMLATKLPAKFDFWVLKCDSKPEVQATEAAMLASFFSTYGDKPLFNEQGGKTVEAEPHPSWFTPLDQRRRGKRHWQIEPV